MRLAKQASAAACAGLVVLGIAGCGSGSGLLSKQQASTLNSELAKAQAALEAKRCSAANSAINTFQDTVNGYSINSTLVSNLNQGAQLLSSKVAKQCPTTNKPAKTVTNTTTHTTATQTTVTHQQTVTTTQSTTTQVPTQTQPQSTTTQQTTTTQGTTTQPSGGGGAGL